MKKTILILSLAILAVFSITAYVVTPKQVDEKKVEYTCPMHPEVISDKPGQCPKCGMDLVIKVAKVEFTCPMHPEVISDKPGKCPKCGMDLVKKENGASKKCKMKKGCKM